MWQSCDRQRGGIPTTSLFYCLDSRDLRLCRVSMLSLRVRLFNKTATISLDNQET